LNSTEPFYSKSLDEVFRKLDTNPETGLKLDEIPQRLAKWGPNELPKVKKSIWRIYFAPVFNLLIIMLIIMAIPIAILGGIMDTIITFGVVVVNAIAAIIQQYRAQKTLESLMKLTAPKAKVIRNGIPMEINTIELVPGDIIDLKQGDKIPTDARIISSMNLGANEAALTGESAAVEKTYEILPESNLPIQAQRNMLFQGAFITSGRCRAVVVYTGANTEIGKISTELNKGGAPEIPITKKMNNFAKWLGLGVIIFVCIALVYRLSLYYASGSTDSINQQIINSIGAGKNLVPLNLPLLTTLILVTGVYNLAKQGVIIRNLTAIEAMGRVSVICSDKTGTITKNEMTVNFIWYENKNLYVPTVDFPNTTPIYHGDMEYDPSSDPYFKLFIDSQVINNTAETTIDLKKITVKGQKEKQVRKVIGSPTEGALLTLAENLGYNIIKIRQQYEILKEFSFDSSVKRMTTLVQDKNQKIYAFTKGASEIILDRCTNIVLDGAITPLTENVKGKIKDDIDAAAKAGFRTLSIAFKPINDTILSQNDRNAIERDLVFLGFVSILDPPREGVKEAIASCEKAQVDVVMITGDHPSTAQAIALEVGILDSGDMIFEGNQIDTLTETEFNKAAVFARVTPRDKVKIVKRYQDQEKRLVAMTGDGVNDSIALKQAQTGIAMGISGSDVAKEAADMVITDDNFISIERGLRVGRGIFHRIRVIIYFFISINLMEAIIFFSFQFYPNPQFSMFTFFQSTYLYITAHTFPSLALIVDSFPKNLMEEPPRNSEEIFARPLLKLMLVQAFFMGIGIALAYLIPLWGLTPFRGINFAGWYGSIPNTSAAGVIFGDAQLKARTMCMTVIFISEMIMVWSMRRPNSSIKDSFLKEFNIWLIIMIAFTLFLHFGSMYFAADVNPALVSMLGEEYYVGWILLNGWDWLWVIGLSSIGIIGVELYKWNLRRKGKYI